MTRRPAEARRGRANEALRDAWAAGEAYEAYMGRWSCLLAPEFLACSFVTAGADHLPDLEGGFDWIVSSLVLNFVPEPERAVVSMRERLGPGGTAAACVWDYAQGVEFLRCFWDEAVASDPAAAQLDEGNRFPLCNREALASLFRAAGFGRVETGALEIPTVFEDFDDYWQPFLGGTGPAPAYVAALDPARREALRARLARRLGAGPGSPIRLRARAWAVRGGEGEGRT